MNSRDVVQGFVESMTQLMAVMKHEVQLVRAREFAKLEDLQRRKLLLAKSYDEHQTRQRKNQSALDSLSGEERGDLCKLSEDFRESLSRSEERRVGKECVSTCRYRGSAHN